MLYRKTTQLPEEELHVIGNRKCFCCDVLLIHKGPLMCSVVISFSFLNRFTFTFSHTPTYQNRTQKDLQKPLPVQEPRAKLVVQDCKNAR